MADLDFTMASSYRIAGTFGLLCSARLSKMAERAGSPVTPEMDRLISSMGGLLGEFDSSDAASIQHFIDDVPVLDDPTSPVYFSCTAAMIAVESIKDRSDSPERLAWRVSSNAMNAWNSCDRILRREPDFANRLCDEMGATLGEFEEREQQRALQGLSHAADVEGFYVEALRHLDVGGSRAEFIATSVARNAGW